MIYLKDTGRGFPRGEFRDRYDSHCSIQKSSLATEDCIWLGVDRLSADRDGPNAINKGFEGSRMHLSREMARDLIPLLERFARTGEL